MEPCSPFSLLVSHINPSGLSCFSPVSFLSSDPVFVFLLSVSSHSFQFEPQVSGGLQPLGSRSNSIIIEVIKMSFGPAFELSTRVAVTNPGCEYGKTLLHISEGLSDADEQDTRLRTTFSHSAGQHLPSGGGGASRFGCASGIPAAKLRSAQHSPESLCHELVDKFSLETWIE